MAKKAVTMSKGKVVVKNPGAVPANFKIGTYKAPYDKALAGALNKVTNWSYDPMQDASYQALAKVYGARGNIAAKNSLADAAALNGGQQTSYAVSAAQQARNQYNQELAALVPELENTAYNRAQGTLSALRDADTTAYTRFRDRESDRQWNWTQAYNKYRDLMSDWQWGLNYNYQQGIDTRNFDYQKQRDAVADSQWAQEFALKKSEASGSGGGGGGGGRSSGGGGGSSSGGGGSGNPYNDLYGIGSDSVSKVHQWDKKNKKILDKTVAKKINTYSGKGR